MIWDANRNANQDSFFLTDAPMSNNKKKLSKMPLSHAGSLYCPKPPGVHLDRGASQKAPTPLGIQKGAYGKHPPEPLFASQIAPYRLNSALLLT